MATNAQLGLRGGGDGKRGHPHGRRRLASRTAMRCDAMCSSDSSPGRPPRCRSRLWPQRHLTLSSPPHTMWRTILGRAQNTIAARSAATGRVTATATMRAHSGRGMHTNTTGNAAAVHTPLTTPASASPSSASSTPSAVAAAAAPDTPATPAAATASSPVAPDDTLLASSILLSRLSEHQYAPAQVREIVEHLLRTHAISLKEMAEPQRNPSERPPPGEFRAAPLSRAAYEVILTALQDAQDLQMFERVWDRMMNQFAPSTAASTVPTSMMKSGSSSATAPSSSPVFHPSAMMYLCRMSLQMQARALDAMEETFRSWKKSVALSKAAATKDPALLAHIIAPPNLLAYHLMLRRLLLTEDSSPDCVPKALKILQEIKSASGVKTKEEMEHEAENGVVASQSQSARGVKSKGGMEHDAENGVASSKSAAPSAHLKPTHLTYHMLLQSLLSHAKRDLRHLTPLLLDMEGQWGLKPSFETLSLGLSVCLEAAKQAQRASKPVQASHGDSKASLVAAQRERAQASANLAQSWKIANQLWRSVQALAASQHTAAEKARNARIAKDKRETPPMDPSSSFAQPPPPPLPPPTPPPASFVPSALWLKYLDLALEARQAAVAFEVISSMQRDAGVLPTAAQIPEILRACVSVAEMVQPPQPKSAAAENEAVSSAAAPGLAPPPKDEEDRAIEMCEWTKACRAIHNLQQKALSTALSMMRAAATYAARSPSGAAAVVPLDHYMSVFAVLSSLGRVEEFARLWRHFMAQSTAAKEAAVATAVTTAAAATETTSNPSAEPTASDPLPLSALSDLVRFALKLDDAAVVELSHSASELSDPDEVSADQVSSAGGELAFSICAFWTRRNKRTKHNVATTSPGETTVAQTAITPSDAPVTEAAPNDATAAATRNDIAAPSVADATTPAAPPPSAFSDLSASDLVPALSSVSASLRSALLASLLAGDHSAEFKMVFEAHKSIVFAEENAQQQLQQQQQRKRNAQRSANAQSPAAAAATKQEPMTAS